MKNVISRFAKNLVNVAMRTAEAFCNIFMMQSCIYYVNLKHCKGLKSNVIVIKTAHRRSDFLKTLISQEIFANIDLRKNLF